MRYCYYGSFERKIQVNELVKAEELLIKAWQGKYFSDEVNALKEGKKLKNKVLINLNPIMIDGIMRVGGRLKNSGLSDDAQQGIIILPFERPRGDLVFNHKLQLASILIMYAHHQTLHGGTQQVLMYLRQRYWIIHAKQAVRYVL